MAQASHRSQTSHAGTRSKRVHLMQPTVDASRPHSQPKGRSHATLRQLNAESHHRSPAADALPARTQTNGALALFDVEQLDTQPIPALHSVIARRHILIVEDDSRMASVIHAALELEGEPSWLVQLAGGGKHALELASATPPDVVLLDVRLPDLEGAEVYHHLRTNTQTHAARILFLSAGTSFDLFQRGIEDGVLLRKPFAMPELVSLVRALLRW